MTPAQILSLGPQLADFLVEFDDCFGRSEPRGHLASYVRGQLSDLPRKSVQPIADFSDTPRRTLQEFLDWSPWDHILLRGRVQQIVARDHADPQAIGIIDDSGHPKSGKMTINFERALRIDEKVLGPEHADVARDLNNLGSLYQDVGRFADAELLIRRALELNEKLSGAEHPNLILVIGTRCTIH